MIENQKSIVEWFLSEAKILPSPERGWERTQDEWKELTKEFAGDLNHLKIGVEMADVVICLFLTAESLGINLEGYVDAKMAINRDREWEVRDGCLYHIKKSSLESLKPETAPRREEG